MSGWPAVKPYLPLNCAVCTPCWAHDGVNAPGSTTTTTRLPPAAAALTWLSRNDQSNWPSAGCTLDQNVRTMTPSSAAFPKVAGWNGTLCWVRAMTPRVCFGPEGAEKAGAVGTPAGDGVPPTATPGVAVVAAWPPTSVGAAVASGLPAGAGTETAAPGVAPEVVRPGVGEASPGAAGVSAAVPDVGVARPGRGVSWRSARLVSRAWGRVPAWFAGPWEHAATRFDPRTARAKGMLKLKVRRRTVCSWQPHSTSCNLAKEFGRSPPYSTFGKSQEPVPMYAETTKRTQPGGPDA